MFSTTQYPGYYTVLAVSPLMSAVALLNEARLLALERDCGAGMGTGGESSLSFSATVTAPVLRCVSKYMHN
jgi:hypothetical protein